MFHSTAKPCEYGDLGLGGLEGGGGGGGIESVCINRVFVLN